MPMFIGVLLELLNLKGGQGKWEEITILRSAKPLFTGSNPVAASKKFKGLGESA